MGKKSKKKQRITEDEYDTPPWHVEGFVPCVCRDPGSVTRGPWSLIFMMQPTFEGTLAVQRHPNMPGATGVRERVIPNTQMKRYTLITDEESALQSYLLDLKKQMLAEGASREAVRLVGEHIPIKKKELKIMAAKLKTKGAAKKAPAKKAAPAKAAKSESKGGGGRKHSLDEAATITLTEKGESKVKKGADTGATANLKAMKKAKTVGKALKAGLNPGDITYAVKTGTVELG